MKITKLTGTEPILGTPSQSILDFWSWAYSDILSNRNRGVFAEFLVASGLGVSGDPRVEWDAVDLRYQGKKIEVKCSAYLQSWSQPAPSRISFDIEKKRGWDAASNTSAPALGLRGMGRGRSILRLVDRGALRLRVLGPFSTR